MATSFDQLDDQNEQGFSNDDPVDARRDEMVVLRGSESGVDDYSLIARWSDDDDGAFVTSIGFLIYFYDSLLDVYRQKLVDLVVDSIGFVHGSGSGSSCGMSVSYRMLSVEVRHRNRSLVVSSYYFWSVMLLFSSRLGYLVPGNRFDECGPAAILLLRLATVACPQQLHYVVKEIPRPDQELLDVFLVEMHRRRFFQSLLVSELYVFSLEMHRCHRRHGHQSVSSEKDAHVLPLV